MSSADRIGGSRLCRHEARSHCRGHPHPANEIRECRKGHCEPKGRKFAGCKLAGIGGSRNDRIANPSGFYKQKAKRIMNLCKYLIEEYGGSLDSFFDRPGEEIREELLKLRGIVPESIFG